MWDYEQVFNLWNDIAHVLQANVYVPLAIIVCDKLEWERKMEEQGSHVWYESSNIVLKLVNLCGTQSSKQSYKRKIMRKVFMVDMKAQISVKGLFNLWWDSYDKQRLWEWDMICCCIVSNWNDLSYEMNIVVQGKQVREKWIRHELILICCLKIGKLAYEIKWWIYIGKEDFMHDTNQCEVQNEWLG